MIIKKITATSIVVMMSWSNSLLAAPDTEGEWSTVLDWPLIAIHAVMTPQGNIFTWGTDEAGVQGAQFSYDLWNPEQGTGAASHNTLSNTLGVDSFCSAAVMLPESGDILMSGGDARPQGATNSGINSAPIFDTGNNTLSSAMDMNAERWYPTSITLPNGEILLNGGRDGQNRTVATPEIYSPSSNSWRSLLGINTASYGYWYPRNWIIPDGRVFGIQNKSMYYLSTTGNGSLQDAGDLPNVSFGNTSTQVMYEPGKILQVSGNGTGAIVNGAVLIDVNGTTPVVRETERPSQVGRRWSNSVVLPNGKVLLSGGSQTANQLVGVAYRPEIWDPATEKWSLMSAGQRSRLYHSTALLLKDGRVLVAGGGAPGPEVNINAEIFSPPYLFDGSELAARPTINFAPDEAPYGTEAFVAHPATDTISRVTLIKTSAVTHSFNMEQRFIELDFSDTTGGIRVNLPESNTIATPGHYMMFLIDNKGVPSEGHIIRLSASATYSEPAYPVALTETESAQAGVPITLNVLANDIGTNLSVTAYNQYSAQGGTITQSGNQLIYTAAASFSGEDNFWYVITDTYGRTNSAKVTLNVSNSSTNPVPLGVADNASTGSGNSITVDVLANDIGNGLVLNTPNIWSLNGGTVALSGNRVSYTASSSFTGEDKVWYTFTDVEGRTSWGLLTITVTGDTPYPVGIVDNVTASSGQTTTIDVLANDIGSGLQLNTPNAYSLNAGDIVLTENKLNYTPKADFTGEDKLWYTFSDSLGRTNWGEVVITVEN